MLLKIKYYLIIMKSILSNRSVVDFWGGSYVVAGNVVKKIRSRK